MESKLSRDKRLWLSVLDYLDINLTYWTTDPQFSERRKLKKISDMLFFNQKDKRWFSLMKISKLPPRSGSIFVKSGEGKPA